MELLSPAGNFLALTGAINAGADAVYLGGAKYGARAYADNFSDEEIIKAIEYAHLFNVKIYLTVNTLIKEREWQDCIDYIRPFYEAGLDACIVQDIGLISVFSKEFPKMECHISTQGFATGLESVRLYKSLGASRVVLARELSLKEIKEIKKNEDIELETFIHGAMCYSYSGQCLFSSCLGGRSGNRGRCAGPCRLPYKYVRNDGSANKENYLLSMKDQCTVSILPSLIEAGIDSLKIEGRMKKPEYSAFVTSIYRKYIDLYMSDPSSYKVSQKDIEDLKHIYLRSEIGEGYYNCRNGKDMLTLNLPGYAGSDERLMDEIKQKYLDVPKKIKVDAFCYVAEDENIILNLSDKDGNTVSVTGPVCEKSQNRPVSFDDIKKQISKMGDCFFCLDDFSSEINGNCFVPVKVLNELRREAVSKLLDEILQNRTNCININKASSSVRVKKTFDKKTIISLLTKEQFDVASMYMNDAYIAAPYELCKELSGSLENILISLPDVSRNDSYEYLDKIYNFAVTNKVFGVIAHNYDELKIFSNFPGVIISGNNLYGFNNSAVETLLKYSDSFIYPLELSRHEINDLADTNGYLNVYGKLPLMRTANCIEKTCNGCSKNKGNCFSHIKDRTNAVFTVYRNCESCYNVIYNSVPTFISDSNIERKEIAFTDESKIETEKVLAYFLKGAEEIPEKYTKGYWKRGIE